MNSYKDPYCGCNKDSLVIAHCGNGQLVADMIGASVGSGAYGKHFSLACQSCKGKGLLMSYHRHQNDSNFEINME